MGFGIVFLGYCFLLLYQTGLGVVAVPFLAYGYLLASRLNKYFLAASISALAMLPRCVILLLDLFLPIAGVDCHIQESYPTLSLITYILFLLAWLSMTMWHCLAVKQIAKDNDYPKLINQANNRMYFSTVTILLAISLVVMHSIIDNMVIILIAYLAMYAVLIVNLLFSHTCFVLITSEKQYEKDKEYVAEQNRLAAEKKKRDKEKFGKRK